MLRRGLFIVLLTLATGLNDAAGGTFFPSCVESELPREQCLDPGDPNSLRDSKLQHAVIRRVKAALRDFPGYAKIRQVRSRNQTGNFLDGALTPSRSAIFSKNTLNVKLSPLQM